MLKFGAQIMLVQAINVTREVGFVTALTAVGGSAAAGFYAMAKRLFSFPIALTGSGLAGLLPGALAQRGPTPGARRTRRYSTRRSSPACRWRWSPARSQPLIGVVLGDTWMPTSDIVLAGSLG